MSKREVYRHMRTLALLAGTLLIGSSSALPQEAGKPTPDQVIKTTKDDGATYGKIKDVKKGDKIVIAVDGAPDKSYSLGDPKRSITVAEDLAVGDPVKVLETNDKKGAKSVQIVRDVRPEARGDQQRSRNTSGK
jgi:hypothetical protein